MTTCYLDTKRKRVQNSDPGTLDGFVKCVAVPVELMDRIVSYLRVHQNQLKPFGIVVEAQLILREINKKCE